MKPERLKRHLDEAKEGKDLRPHGANLGHIIARGNVAELRGCTEVMDRRIRDAPYDGNTYMHGYLAALLDVFAGAAMEFRHQQELNEDARHLMREGYDQLLKQIGDGERTLDEVAGACTLPREFVQAKFEELCKNGVLDLCISTDGHPTTYRLTNVRGVEVWERMQLIRSQQL